MCIDCSRIATEHSIGRPNDIAGLAGLSTGIDFDTASCDTALIGGHVDVQNDPGNILRIGYEGYGKWSATYNGQMLPVPPPEG